MLQIFLLIAFLSLSFNTVAGKPGTSGGKPNNFKSLQPYTDTMQPGEWKELPGQIPLWSDAELNEIQALHGGHDIKGYSGSTSVLYSWTGSAFDGHRWWFFGGGHADYGGNEVYQYDFSRLEWSRLTAPSPLTKLTGSSNGDPQGCPMPENGPAATHTYDGFTWNPQSQTIWLTSQAGFCLNGYYTDPDRPFWEFDPKRKTWTQHDSFNIKTGYALSEWNPDTNRLVVFPKDYNAEAFGPFELDGSGAIYRRRPTSWGKAVGNLSYNSADKSMYAIEGKNLKEQLLIGPDPYLPKWTTVSEIPQEWLDNNMKEAGSAYHPGTNSMIYWTGFKATWAYDFDDGTYRRINNLDSVNVPTTPFPRVYSKWIYLPELDVFAGYMNTEGGIWLYKLGEFDEPDLNVDRACIGTTCYKSIAAAFAALNDGETVTILPGEWDEGGTIIADDITVIATGAILTKAVSGKGAIVAKGKNLVVDGLECKNISVSSGNGVCVRIEGQNITLKNLYVHDCQQGLLSNNLLDAAGVAKPGVAQDSTITIKDSVFENNGINSGTTGQQHGIYIGSGGTLIVRGSTITNNFKQGHEFKSRARVTIIEDSTITSGEGVDSRTIDIPNGGEVTITRSILQHGVYSVNHDFIGYGHEGQIYDTNSFVITDSTILSDDPLNRHILFAKSSSMPDPIFTNNTIIGVYASDISNHADNCYFNTRSDAGLPELGFGFGLVPCTPTPAP